MHMLITISNISFKEYELSVKGIEYQFLFFILITSKNRCWNNDFLFKLCNSKNVFVIVIYHNYRNYNPNSSHKL